MSDFKKTEVSSLSPAQKVQINFDGTNIDSGDNDDLARSAKLSDIQKTIFKKMFERPNLTLSDAADSNYDLTLNIRQKFQGFRNIEKQFPLGPYQVWGILSLGTLTLIPYREERSCEVVITLRNKLSKKEKAYSEKVEYVAWAQLFLLPYSLIKYGSVFKNDEEIQYQIIQQLMNEIVEDLNKKEI